MKKFLEIIKNKWLIKGTTTLLLVLIVIGCYIGLNMLVEKINVENLDFTEKKLYSLSDETKTKLKDLNQDVTIQLINAKGQNIWRSEKYQDLQTLSAAILEKLSSVRKPRSGLLSTLCCRAVTSCSTIFPAPERPRWRGRWHALSRVR